VNSKDRLVISAISIQSSGRSQVIRGICENDKTVLCGRICKESGWGFDLNTRSLVGRTPLALFSQTRQAGSQSELQSGFSRQKRLDSVELLRLCIRLDCVRSYQKL
jgi:hypothetical protein